jgi:acyl phosphate:glycerol-3-phosphate acyltransferase
MQTLAVASAAYLIGSISFAVVASRLFGLPDPRTYGSGNPGATNVLRTGKKAAAVITLLGDAVKGVLAVAIAQWLAGRFNWGEAPVAGAALAAFLGHLYPLYFGFRGGKGVATAFGVLIALDVRLALVVLAVFLGTALATRYISLASMLAALAAAVLGPHFVGWSATAGAVGLISLLLIWRHRANIGRLIAGEESKVRLGKRVPPQGQA